MRGLFPKRVDGHGGKGDGGLLPRGQKHVHLPLGRQRGDLAGHPDEIVSDAGHCGDHDDHAVPRLLRGDDAAGDIEDAAGSADGGAAVFLDYDAHGRGGEIRNSRLEIRK